MQHKKEDKYSVDSIIAVGVTFGFWRVVRIYNNEIISFKNIIIWLIEIAIIGFVSFCCASLFESMEQLFPDATGTKLNIYRWFAFVVFLIIFTSLIYNLIK